MKYLIILLFVYALLILISGISLNNQKADYLIVLGSGLYHNKETLTMIRRINRAVMYLYNNPDTKVIVSGGITDNNKISEAEVMQRLLLERRIKEDRIILEDRSRNTIENISNSLSLIDDRNKKIVICSNDYHVLRAKLLARKKGYDVFSISSQTGLLGLLIHLPMEMFLIIHDLICS